MVSGERAAPATGARQDEDLWRPDAAMH